MPTHREKYFLPYTVEQIYDLVVDIDRYPEFLPWCLEAHVREKSRKKIIADLAVGYSIFKERFTSRVLLSPPNRIDVVYEEGPFEHLDNHWIFTPINKKHGNKTLLCEIDFYVDFAFKSPTFEKLMQGFFVQAVHHMVQAFEERAKTLYG
ncbi:MAG: type II toxin-antitoxin system RatA family toxin [Alphaproteobacteria bacterium]|mgnify:CR=1 FL=1|nr:type II toxin-antitoxin system RatA family toxin [Alphaproteobacteria bacterium]MBT5389989.1 type II toxin-antitoxin system RatA family toxin [Alphaproteobacteria bacterium]